MSNVDATVAPKPGEGILIEEIPSNVNMFCEYHTILVVYHVLHLEEVFENFHAGVERNHERHFLEDSCGADFN